MTKWDAAPPPVIDPLGSLVAKTRLGGFDAAVCLDHFIYDIHKGSKALCVVLVKL